MTNSNGLFDNLPTCPLTGLPIKGKAAFTPYQGNNRLVLYEFAPIGKVVFDFDVLVDVHHSLVTGNHTPSSKLAGLSREATEKGLAPLHITNLLVNEARGITETLEEKRAHLLQILYLVDSQEYRARDILLHNDFPLAFAKDAEEFSRILEACVKKGLIQYDKPNDTPNAWPFGMRTHYYDVSLTGTGEKVARELIALPRITSTTMTDEDIIRRQAQAAYSNAIAQVYPFNTPQGVVETRRRLIEGLQRHYQKNDKVLYLDEVNNLLNAELADHKLRCKIKEPCPLEAGIHEVLYFMKQESNKLSNSEPQLPSFSSQHFHFAENSTNNVATGAHAVQSANTGQGAQLNIASGSNITQGNTGSQATSLPELVELLKQALAATPQLDTYREEIGDEVQRIEAQLRRPEPKRSILARSFETLNDLVKDGIGSAGGHIVYELLQQVPTLLASFN